VNLLDLRHFQIAGTPLELKLPRIYSNINLAKKKLGYGKNVLDWAISIQAPYQILFCG